MIERDWRKHYNFLAPKFFELIIILLILFVVALIYGGWDDIIHWNGWLFVFGIIGFLWLMEESVAWGVEKGMRKSKEN